VWWSTGAYRSRRPNSVREVPACIGPHASPHPAVFRFQRQTGCRRRNVVMAEDDPQATSTVHRSSRDNVVLCDGDGSIVATRNRTPDYSPLMLAALMIGHHFSISALCNAPSASGVCCSRGKISCPRSARRARAVGSARPSTTAALSRARQHPSACFLAQRHHSNPNRASILPDHDQSGQMRAKRRLSISDLYRALPARPTSFSRSERRASA
jgi:hypothetical protein